MAFRSPSIWPSRLQCLAKRAFSTSTTFLAKSAKNKLASIHANIPPYPHGPNLWYKQSNFGLFGATRIRSGNNVSPRTETKTRRKWRPNIQRKRLWSRALSQYVRVKVSTRVLRTIDKCGGLDEYLLGEKSGRVRELGMKGWELRWRVMGSSWYRKRRDIERVRLGLVGVEGEELAGEAERAAMEVAGEEGMEVGRDGSLVSMEELEHQIQAYDAENKSKSISLGEEADEKVSLIAEEPRVPKSEVRI